MLAPWFAAFVITSPYCRQSPIPRKIYLFIFRDNFFNCQFRWEAGDAAYLGLFIFLGLSFLPIRNVSQQDPIAEPGPFSHPLFYHASSRTIQVPSKSIGRQVSSQPTFVPLPFITPTSYFPMYVIAKCPLLHQDHALYYPSKYLWLLWSSDHPIRPVSV